MVMAHPYASDTGWGELSSYPVSIAYEIRLPVYQQAHTLGSHLLEAVVHTADRGRSSDDWIRTEREGGPDDETYDPRSPFYPAVWALTMFEGVAL